MRVSFCARVIHLPIIGAAEPFCWGVWGSLSRANFETLLNADETPDHVDLPPMFSWLSSQIPGYPDTLSLKMYAQFKSREPVRIFVSTVVITRYV